ncbi:uncharacterized protein LOC122804069 [Protopterus annectens]|uniref:uncharacterized protein LOC122804069 n=1 Tax=Protopterus annectens TaxID=7888 RepID=UPI001CFABB1F|nr:uncharacterized protein LOC122804069 [Protopterus annectens]
MIDFLAAPNNSELATTKAGNEMEQQDASGTLCEEHECEARYHSLREELEYWKSHTLDTKDMLQMLQEEVNRSSKKFRNEECRLQNGLTLLEAIIEIHKQQNNKLRDNNYELEEKLQKKNEEHKKETRELNREMDNLKENNNKLRLFITEVVKINEEFKEDRELWGQDKYCELEETVERTRNSINDILGNANLYVETLQQENEIKAVPHRSWYTFLLCFRRNRS